MQPSSTTSSTTINQPHLTTHLVVTRPSRVLRELRYGCRCCCCCCCSTTNSSLLTSSRGACSEMSVSRVSSLYGDEGCTRWRPFCCDRLANQTVTVDTRSRFKWPTQSETQFENVWMLLSSSKPLIISTRRKRLDPCYHHHHHKEAYRNPVSTGGIKSPCAVIKRPRLAALKHRGQVARTRSVSLRRSVVAISFSP